tara:strand:- start:519 stop:905 length:387 start_codon:yes stop_codon:yes gene_type:complete
MFLSIIVISKSSKQFIKLNFNFLNINDNKKTILFFNNLLKKNFGRAKILKIVKNCLVLQIKKNFSKKPFVFKTCSNSFAFVQKGIDSESISGLFYYGLNEFNEVLFSWHILSPDDIFLILELIRVVGD